MSTHNICFCREIKKQINILVKPFAYQELRLRNIYFTLLFLHNDNLLTYIMTTLNSSRLIS